MPIKGCQSFRVRGLREDGSDDELPGVGPEVGGGDEGADLGGEGFEVEVGVGHCGWGSVLVVRWGPAVEVGMRKKERGMGSDAMGGLAECVGGIREDRIREAGSVGIR